MYFNSSEHFPDLNGTKTKLNEALLFELFELMAKHLKTMKEGGRNTLLIYIPLLVESEKILVYALLLNYLYETLILLLNRAYWYSTSSPCRWQSHGVNINNFIG